MEKNIATICTTVEVTEGRNGYPMNLRRVVKVDSGVDDVLALAQECNGKLISIRRRDGWQLWERENCMNGKYDMYDVIVEEDDAYILLPGLNESRFLLEVSSDLRDADDAWEEYQSMQNDEMMVIKGHKVEVVKRYVNSYHEDVWEHSLAIEVR